MQTGSGSFNTNVLQGVYENLSSTYKKAKSLRLIADDLDICVPIFPSEGSWVSSDPRGFIQYLTSRLNSSGKVANTLKVCIRSIYWSEKYKAESLKYKRFAKFLQKEVLNNRFLGRYFDVMFDSTQFEYKLQLTNKLIDLATQLFQQHSHELETEFRIRESELLSQLTREEYYELNHSGTFIQLADLLKKVMRGLRYEIVLILRKLRRTRTRDVRTKLREVVGNHFKFIDDESDADQSFFNQKIRLITSKIILKWIPNKQLNSSIIY